MGHRVVEKKLLFVDSRDRDPADPNPFDFTITFNSARWNIPSFMHVSDISVKAFCMPKVMGEDYVYLDLGPKLNTTVYASDETVGDSILGVFYFDHGSMATGAVKPMKGSDFTPKVSVFDPILTEMDRLPIRVIKHGGVTVTKQDVATDPNADLSGFEPSFSMLIEMTCMSRAL